ncbi:Fc.00g016460.m01.CDS01 [Cosmosporella sp. VM-42]
MAICKFFSQGYCKFGNNCRFEHPSATNNRPQTSNRFGAFGAASGGGNQSNLSNSYNISPDVIEKDLTSEPPQWIFSAYAPGRDAPGQLFGGFPREQSFEELRLLHLIAKAAGNEQQAVNQAQELWKESKQQMENAARNSKEALQFIVSAENNHPNRADICREGTQGAPFGEFLVGKRPRSLVPEAPTQPNPFGTNNNTSSPFGGGAATATPSAFGQPSALGQQPSAFGKSSFGQPSQPATSSPFGQTATTSAFGQPSQGASPFGQPTQPPQSQSAFGQPSALGAKPSPFGTPAFGQPSQPSAPGNAFGQPLQPSAPGNAFGQPSQLGQQVNPFGSPTNAAQGSGPFGAVGSNNNNAPANPFGAPSSNQNNPAANPFGSTANNQTNNSSSPFGQPSQPPQPTSNPFGQPSAPAAPNPFASANQAPAPDASNPFAQKSPQQQNGFPAQNQQQANPFGQPSNSSPFGQPSNTANQQGNPAAAAQPPKAAGQPGNPYPPGSAKQHPPIESYASKTMDGRLSTFKGKPVTYKGDKPGIREFNGTWKRIWFPDGPPGYAKETEVPPEEYDEKSKAQWSAFAQTGNFEGGLMPEVPPPRECTLWDF